MSQLEVKIQYMSDQARTLCAPRYATEGSAGCDLCACLEEPVTLQPGQTVRIPTGIAISLSSADYCALVVARSGLSARHGITMVNAVGVIDSDYTGEIQCPVIHLGKEPFEITPGMRIAQMLIVPVMTACFSEVSRLDETARGDGGFGSTGV